jgi:hypothetical protein
MKVLRTIIIAVIMVVFIFIMAPLVSAQMPDVVWLKGQITIKGYDIDATVNEVTVTGKGNMAQNLYVAIGKVPNQFYVTTCAPNEATGSSDDWILTTKILPIAYTYGDCNDENGAIFDFRGTVANAFAFNNAEFNATTYPSFNVRCTENKILFRSFACKAYVQSVNVLNEQFVGSCIINLESINELKVPIGCIDP